MTANESFSKSASLLITVNNDYLNSFVVVTFITIVLVLQIMLQDSLLHNLEKWIPESLTFIVVGLISGGCCHVLVGENFFYSIFGPRIFFDYLLPPIILEAAFELYSREFFLQIDGILLLAVVGTALNTLSIGGTLHILSRQEMISSLSLIDCLIYGSIVAAVRR